MKFPMGLLDRGSQGTKGHMYFLTEWGAKEDEESLSITGFRFSETEIHGSSKESPFMKKRFIYNIFVGAGSTLHSRKFKIAMEHWTCLMVFPGERWGYPMALPEGIVEVQECLDSELPSTKDSWPETLAGNLSASGAGGLFILGLVISWRWFFTFHHGRPPLNPDFREYSCSSHLRQI